jgi:hypothetical protein
MAKVTLMAGIVSLRGKVGEVYYRTTKKGEIQLCKMPSKSERTMSVAQKKQQERFGSVVRKVHEVLKDPLQREVMEQMWKKLGRKNETLRGFAFRQINGFYPK